MEGERGREKGWREKGRSRTEGGGVDRERGEIGRGREKRRVHEGMEDEYKWCWLIKVPVYNMDCSCSLSQLVILISPQRHKQVTPRGYYKQVDHLYLQLECCCSPAQRPKGK